jgi:hypothetical protein
LWEGRDVILAEFREFFQNAVFDVRSLSSPAPVAFDTVALVAHGILENFQFVRTFTIQKIEQSWIILSDQVHFLFVPNG